MKQTIFKEPIRRDFQKLPHVISRNEKLSFEARGILAFIFSHTDFWRIRMEDLERMDPKRGREHIRESMRELEALGYAVRHMEVDPITRKFVGTMWTWHHKPVAPTARTTGKRVDKPNDRKPGDGNPSNGKPLVGNPSELRRVMYEEDHYKEERLLKEEERVAPIGGLGRWELSAEDLAFLKD